MSVTLYSSGSIVAVEDYTSGIVVAAGGTVTSMGTANATADFTTINEGGLAHIYNGGIMNSTLAEGTTSARIYVSSGGIAYDTTLGQAGNLQVSNGGQAVRTTGGAAAGNAFFTVFDGGLAVSTTAQSGLRMHISSGGSASGVDVASAGVIVYVSNGGAISDAVAEAGAGSGWLRVGLGGRATDTVLSSGCGASVVDGAVFSGTSILSGGKLIVSSGGVAYDTIADAGAGTDWLAVSNGGSAIGTVISSGNALTVESGRTFVSTTVESTGRLYVSSGANVSETTIETDGAANAVWVYAGGVVYNTVVKATVTGALRLDAGASAVGTVINNTGTNFTSTGAGGVFYDTNIVDGRLLVNAGGFAINTIVGDRMDVYGTASNVIVSSGAELRLFNSTELRGSLQIESGGKVIVGSNAPSIDFTAAERSINDTYLINDLSNFGSNPTYTLTVDDDQTTGVYKLAQGAGSFTNTVTLRDAEGDLDTLTVNGATVTAGGRDYSLAQSDGNLTLNIAWNSASVDVGDTTLITSSFVGTGKNVMTGGTIVNAFIGMKNPAENASVKSYITGGTVGNSVIGGAMVLQNQTASIDTVLLDISGGDIIGGAPNGGMVYTAGYAYGADPNTLDSSATLTVQKSILKLSGDSAIPAQNFYAGAHARKGAYTLVNTSEIAVTGGTYGRIYGGGWAEKVGLSEVGASTITVSGGEVDFIYAGGGNAEGGETAVLGNVTIDVSGDAQVNFAFLAGKNKFCSIGGKVTMTVSGSSKTMTRVSGYNANGDDNTVGVTTLDLKTSLDVEYLDHVDVVRIAEGKTLNVSADLWYEAASALKIDFALDGALDTDWTAMSGVGMDIYREAQYTINGSSVVYTYDEATNRLGDSGYGLDFSEANKVKFITIA